MFALKFVNIASVDASLSVCAHVRFCMSVYISINVLPIDGPVNLFTEESERCQYFLHKCESIHIGICPV